MISSTKSFVFLLLLDNYLFFLFQNKTNNQKKKHKGAWGDFIHSLLIVLREQSSSVDSSSTVYLIYTFILPPFVALKSTLLNSYYLTTEL